MTRRSLRPFYFEEQYNRTLAGFAGEKILDREWKDINYNGLLFHDFTFYNNATHTHQIDTIYVCQHFVLVIEVKHLTGALKIDPETYRCTFHPNEGPPKPIKNPIEQAKRHRNFLRSYFNNLSYSFPIEAAVVMTNTECQFENIDSDVPMFLYNGLSSKLDELTKKYQNVNINIGFVRSQLENLHRKFTKEPWRSDETPRTGVLCLKCNQKMIPTNNSFKCFRCNICDKKHLAIRQTLYDYKILYGPEITNSQFRFFTEIKSRTTASGILGRLLPKKIKAGRGSKYYIPHDINAPLR